MSIPVGIDLGTTYSAVAFVDEFGSPVCIQNNSGDFATPSVVYFDETVARVGKAAEYLERQHPERVVRFIKQRMGKRDWHYTDIVGMEWSPEAISALILKKLKQVAEAFLEQAIQDAVITVPAYFMDPQRQATIEAGEIAGLNVIGIVNEPTAAALAFAGKTSVSEASQTILVYDLGGGTFDVTILRIGAERLQVLGTAGNVELGGTNFDTQIVQALSEQFREVCGVDPLGDQKGAALLRGEAVTMKEALTQLPLVSSEIHFGGKQLTAELSREQFGELTAGLLDLTRVTMLNLLDELELSWDHIDRILLAGGSTYMPVVREMLQEISGKSPSCNVNPDQAVAIGAAFWACSENVRQGITEDSLRSAPAVLMPVQDVSAHSLGTLVESLDEPSKLVVDVIIPRNMPLPCETTKRYATLVENQESVRIEVFQGEDADPQYCNLLGEAMFGPLPPAPSGAPVEITFAYDANGIVQVKARDPHTDQQLDFEVKGSFDLPSESLDLQKQLVNSRNLE